MTVGELKARILAHDPEAERLQCLWLEKLAGEAKARGESPRVTDESLALLGISIEDWWAMTADERLRAIVRCFEAEDSPNANPY